MQKHFEHLDDYDDQSESPLLEAVKDYVACTITFLAALACILAICGIIQGR
jgi:hypothetical protein